MVWRGLLKLGPTIQKENQKLYQLYSLPNTCFLILFFLLSAFFNVVANQNWRIFQKARVRALACGMNDPWNQKVPSSGPSLLGRPSPISCDCGQGLPLAHGSKLQSGPLTCPASVSEPWSTCERPSRNCSHWAKSPQNRRYTVSWCRRIPSIKQYNMRVWSGCILLCTLNHLFLYLM